MVSLADKFEEISKHYKKLADEARQLEAQAKELEEKEKKLSFFKPTVKLSEKIVEGKNVAQCISVKEIKLKGTNGQENCLKLKFKVGQDEKIGCESISISKMDKDRYKKLLYLKDKNCRLNVSKSGSRFKINDIEIASDTGSWVSIWNAPANYSTAVVRKNISNRIKDIPGLMADICCKYDIKLEETKFGQTVYRTEISPESRKVILDNAIKMWNNGKSGYRKLSTVVCGLYGEQCVINIVNAIYDYFHVDRKLFLNTKKYRFTGDGATDFVIEGIACDAKYRNSTKNDGMATKIKDIRADVLLLTTGATDYSDKYFETNDGSTHVVYFTGFTDKISFRKFAIKNGLAYSDLMDHPFTKGNSYYGMKPFKKLKSADDFINLILTKTLKRLEEYDNV